MRSRLVTVLSTTACTALAAAFITVPAAGPASADLNPPAGAAATVTGAPVATWQTNGTVRAIETVGDTVWVGGNFTSVRPPGAAAGTGEVARYRLAAFDVNTGALKPAAPLLDAPNYTAPAGQPLDTDCTRISAQVMKCASVFAIEKSPDSSRIFVGGDFRTADGADRPGLAAFNASTGALDAAFAPGSFEGRINAIAVSPTTVYAGGRFAKTAGAARTNLAAVNAASGALLPWAPTADRPKTTLMPINGLEMSDDNSRVVVAGTFDKLNGASSHAIGAVSASGTGANVAWQDKRIAATAVVTSTIKSGGVIYTTGLDTTGSWNEGVTAYNPMTGAAVWNDGCSGASHSAAVLRGVVYVGSHSHDCSAMINGFGEQYHGYGSDDARRYTLRAEVPSGSRAALLHWFPTTNDGNGAYDMAADANNLWIGGEFTKVDGANQQGLTHFRLVDSGGDNHAPAAPRYPAVFSTVPGKVEISWQASEDSDSQTLSYQLIKDGNTAAPIATVSSSAAPWLRNWMTFTDTAVAGGEEHYYSVRAVDPRGLASPPSPDIWVAVASAKAAAPQVPDLEWALAHYAFDQSSGTNFVDRAQGRLAKKGSGVTTGASGTGFSGVAAGFSGAAGGVVVDAWVAHSQRAVSYEMAFKTASVKGGVLSSIGDSASTTAVSSANTQVLYMSNNGTLNFGLTPDTARTDPWALAGTSRKAVATTAKYNDNKWHHVAVTFDPAAGTKIYVDGALAASDPSMVWSRSVYGSLRLGGDRVASWPKAPTSPWFAGSIDEFATYDYPLTAAQIARHSAALRNGT